MFLFLPQNLNINDGNVQSVFHLPHLRDFEEKPRIVEPWVVKEDRELKNSCLFQFLHTKELTGVLPLILLHCVFHFCRYSPRLVRLCPLVGTKALLASENTLDSGQMWSPGRCKASLHSSA